MVGSHVHVTSEAVENGMCALIPDPGTDPTAGAGLKVNKGAGGDVSPGFSAHAGVVSVNVAYGA